MSLLVLGSAAYDTIETPFDRRDRVLGGSGVYSAMAASLLSDARLVGVVGEDWRGSDTEILKDRGIDLSGLEVRAGAKTLYWSGKYFNNMNDRETKEIELNVMGEAWDPIVPESYKKSDYTCNNGRNYGYDIVHAFSNNLFSIGFKTSSVTSFCMK